MFVLYVAEALVVGFIFVPTLKGKFQRIFCHNKGNSRPKNRSKEQFVENGYYIFQRKNEESFVRHKKKTEVQLTEVNRNNDMISNYKRNEALEVFLMHYL